MKNPIIIACALFLAAVLPARAEAPKRLVSLGGAVTEIVYALGAGGDVVGTDTTSYFPPEAEKTPKVGYFRALSAEGIMSLSPDLVLMTNEAGPPPVLAQLKAAGVAILTLKAGRSVADVTESIREVGRALGRQTEAAALVKSLADAGTALAHVVTSKPGKKRVMFILQPGGGTPMVAGQDTAADSIIDLAGAANAVIGFDGYKPLTPEAAVNAAPEIILITTQGLKQIGGRAALRNMPGLALTPAMRDGRIVEMDSLLLLGFGPRTVDAALELNRQFRTP